MTSDFDEDTAVSPDGEVTLTGRWNGIAGVVNGGYEMAVCAKALAWIMPHPDPLVISGFFLRPGNPGPATVRTELLRAGRSMSFGTAALMQDGKETVRATAVFSQPGHQNGLLFQAAEKPELPPPDDCVGYPPGQPGVAIAERIEYRFPELPGWASGGPGAPGGGPSGNPSMQFWIRFADGSDASQFALPLLVDATAPGVLALGALSTTVELTVHLRARPAPGWLACRAVTRYVSGGYHEEDFEIWDSAGILVAQSRQLCLILR